MKWFWQPKPAPLPPPPPPPPPPVWAGYARVERVERNNGEVTFHPQIHSSRYGWVSLPFFVRETTHNSSNYQDSYPVREEAFEVLDAWWQGWWPRQVKSRTVVS